MTIRIIIVDDHGLFRAGLHALLANKPDIQVVGEASDGETAFRLVSEHQPDLVLMDVSMPGLTGIEATKKIKEQYPGIIILALTVHEDESVLREMIRAGASGYIIKRAVEAELINAIHTVLEGNMYVHPAMTRILFMEKSLGVKPSQTEPDPLTNREIEILTLLAKGYTNRQIANELNISPRTVEGHRSSLVGKLGFNSRVDLINYAEKHGLLK